MLEVELIEEAYKEFEKQGTILLDKMVAFDYRTFFSSMIFSGFLLYGRIMTFMTKIYINMYNHFEWVRNMDYNMKYGLQYLHALIFLYTTEPYKLTWYSNCWIEKTSIDQYIFHEKIADSEDNDKTGKYCLIDMATENWPYDPMFIGKIMPSINCDPKYYCRRIDGRETEQDNVNISLFPAIPSSTHFLSVIYKHPEIEKPIELSIKNGWFMEGNEILSASFIHRELAYQSKSFIFDKEYTVQIIDENINIIEIGYYEYIIIKNDSYEIIDIKQQGNKSMSIPMTIKDEDEYDYIDSRTTINGKVSFY